MTLPKDLWGPFQAKYGHLITKIPDVSGEPLTAQELHAQAARTWSGSAAGLDGWKPLELKFLPLEAWRSRGQVEALFTRVGRLPQVYYQVPVSMLRKAEGLTPLQHRGISVFAAHYRLAGCAWWHRTMPSFLQWVHPAAAGGLPGRECLESAWDAQQYFEKATLTGQKAAAILMDYDKFFDRFDCQFFRQLFIALGMPGPVCTLFGVMYGNIQRRLKISGHLDVPLQTDCGAGQGDSFSLLGALCITTLEFRLLDARWPNVVKGSVVDDRDLVGSVQDVVGATLDCLEFDRMAGLRNTIP